MWYRDEAQQVQEEQQYHKFHQKQMEAQQDSAWAHSVPEWHEAELVGQNKPWTVPSQLLTAEEEVCLQQSAPWTYLGTGFQLLTAGEPGSQELKVFSCKDRSVVESALD